MLSDLLMTERKHSHIDYADENDGSLDVWGWDDDTPEDESEWRVRLVEIDNKQFGMVECDD